MRVLKEIMEDYPDLLEDVKSNVRQKFFFLYHIFTW